ncbi:MAG TPA: MlaD family protein [Lacunisphaera sp.]|nr:MlaD family protein [Lacunisphaera sp.]
MTASTPSSSRSVALVWLVPVIALLVSGWLIARQFLDSGPIITIEFASGAGIQAGKTPLVYNGVVVGLVEKVSLSEKLDGVMVEVRLEPSAAPLAVEGSEFWLVRPEIGLSGIKGLETLLSGAQLRVHAGRGEPAREFSALPRAPSHEAFVAGRQFVLRSDQLNSLNPGAPVFYREMKVGVVESHELAPDATHVRVTVNVFEPYHRLVHKDTQFWNAGGLSMKLGLLGAHVQSSSLESLVAGGVAFATPEQGPGAEPAAENTVFEVNAEADKAWLKWQPKIDLLPSP